MKDFFSVFDLKNREWKSQQIKKKLKKENKKEFKFLTKAID